MPDPQDTASIKTATRKPTKLQLRTAEIKATNPKMSLGEAMRQAGYAKTTSLSPKDNFLDLKGTETAVELFKNELAGQGITTKKLAKKYAEWLDATKIKSSLTEPDQVVPDYETQLKAKDDLIKILNIGGEEFSEEATFIWRKK